MNSKTRVLIGVVEFVIRELIRVQPLSEPDDLANDVIGWCNRRT